MSQTDSEKVIIGRIGAAYGIKGWVKVISFTEPADNILAYQPWLIKQHGQWQTVSFEDSKLHSGNYIVKLPGCNDRDQAQRLTHADIAIYREQLPELEENEFFWSDLIGLTVENLAGIELGTVEQLLATGSNDVLVVEGDKERLIPYLSTVIKSVDLTTRKIIVDWDADF